MAPKYTGLSSAEVSERIARGEVNRVDQQSSRSVSQILKGNIFTRFNAILGSLFAVIVVVGPIQDALFGIVLFTNALIGIIQELRAKWTLDKLVILAAPKVQAIRDGETVELLSEDLVLGDLVDLGTGDQVPVDGVVIESRGLELDESLLTGESDSVAKESGDAVMSGSFVVAGSGLIEATAVGADSYAQDLAVKAKRFALTKSELRSGIDQILKYITWALVPTGILLIISQSRAHEDWREAVSGSVAGVVGMVPEGLVLLTSMAMALAVLRLGRRQVLVQELSAVEGLARVDVVCLDKTGTLTEGRSEYERMLVLGGGRHAEAEIGEVLGAMGEAEPNPNNSLQAIIEKFGEPPAGKFEVLETAPFSSARKWSGVAFEGRGTWVMGAPEIVLPPDSDARAEADRISDSGSRVIALARSDGKLEPPKLPKGLRPVALVMLAERIRADAPDTLEFFSEQGVSLRIISGDNPRTVGAIASRLGIEGAESPVDARDLPDDPDDLAEVMETQRVFGRVTPDQKRAMVSALQSRGHTVAMTGDGVNDALALKDSDIGIAMGSGSAASRAVAQLVLLDSKFATMPGVVAEGRRVIANIERTANLFLTKSTYVMLLALTVGVLAMPFPFLPRHLTIVGAVTIGIPGFFLSLAPNSRRARLGFVRRVLQFSVPAGLVAAAATFVAYGLVRWTGPPELEVAQTAASLTLVTCGLWILGLLARPFRPWKIALIASMVGTVLLVLVVPPIRSFYALTLLPPEIAVETAVVAAVACSLLEIGWRLAQSAGARRKGDKIGSS
ncbi:MAG: magnesium-transporting ATPase [Acidobacteria bacterium]|nr:MAG: magnesium-transporting ATPase [Acidobacteriota bacterium]